MNTMKTTTEESIMQLTTAFAVPGEDNIIDMRRSDGTSFTRCETLEEIRQRYPGAEVVSFDDFCASKAGRQDTPIQWEQTTEAKFWQMLEVLPPIDQGKGGFLVGEPWDHHAKTGQPRYAAYRVIYGNFWTANRPMTRKEFAAEMLTETLNTTT
jgi:hypothetical protein